MLVKFSHILRSVAEKSRVTLVTGNQSADMDSVVSAIAYSTLSSKSLVLPLINIPRQDFDLRRDIVHVMKHSDINVKDLIFLDDIESCWDQLAKTKVDLVLVDHNKPQGDVVNNLMNELGATVVGIIDHHEDEKLFTNASPRIIKKSGSCVSLVLNHFKEQVARIDPKLAKLFLSPLVIDTSGLKHRVEQVDKDALELLLPKLQADQAFLQAWTNELNTAKQNVEGLSLRDLLRKDYKEYRTVGISSMVVSLDYLSRFDLLPSLESWIKERKLDIAIIMTSYNDKKFHREIMFHGDDAKIRSLLNQIQEPLGLEPLAKFPFSFEQREPVNSRKQVAPLVNNWLDAQGL
ncbi:hypothetical protein KL949_002103 [Ogataea haglerorum]|nr:hypothetical protein KL913_002035 [Ogataea haglerorum]KAG7720138.1 hypothetical protein KL949_002103 [Ogataea haglerorum]KAG7768593.1 hypothetical protein KL931_003199 [Ogataea haglerorum]